MIWPISVGAVLTVLLVVDARQTLDIKNHANIREMNRILGDHPSDRRIKAYFALCIMGNIVATWLVATGRVADPAWWLAGQGAVIGVEWWCLLNNHKLGLRA